MITDTCQRYTDGVESRRPAGELIRPSIYDAEPVSPTIAVDFVKTHHYAHECSSRSHTFALWKRGALVGVAAFGALPSTNAHKFVFPSSVDQKHGVTLGRFVLNENVEGNGESWFVSRCFELLRSRGVIAIESCADMTRGHCGIIYQATNGHYVGLTNRATRYMLPDGTELSNRARSKLTTGERGAGRAVDQLVSFGAEPPRPGEDVLEWLRRWRPRICRSFRHPGNFRYLWCLDRRYRREVLSRFPRKPYPKIRDYQ